MKTQNSFVRDFVFVVPAITSTPKNLGYDIYSERTCWILEDLRSCGG